MLRLSDTAAGLSIYTPAWIALIALVLGVALGAYVLRGKAGGKALGAAAAALVMVYAGWYFLWSKTTLDGAGVVVRGPFGTQAQARWSEVQGADMQERSEGRGGRANVLVLRLASGGEIPIKISGLPPEQAVRVIRYVESRLGKPQGRGL